MKKILHDSSVARLEFAKIMGNKNAYHTFLLFTVKQLKTDGEDFGELCKDLANIYKNLHKKGIKFCQIYDLTKTKITNIYNETIFVKRYGDYLDKYANILIESCHGTALVIESHVVTKLINTGLTWYTHKKPTQVKNNHKEAYKWLLTTIPDENFVASD